MTVPFQDGRSAVLVLEHPTYDKRSSHDVSTDSLFCHGYGVAGKVGRGPSTGKFHFRVLSQRLQEALLGIDGHSLDRLAQDPPFGRCQERISYFVYF